jgi:3-methyladenine DNA glycosylase AlkD
VKPEEITSYLKSLGDPKIAEHSQRFFKTGKGEYGAGDVFLGIRVPVLRQAVKKFNSSSTQVAEKLLKSKYHEVRLFALFLLVFHFSKADADGQEKIYRLYLKNTRYINNWDLVDGSAHQIVGGFLIDKDKSILFDLAKSDSLWERRIAIISTYHFIKKNKFRETLLLSKQLRDDSEDLIHKAVGWMLREVGNRDKAKEIAFL